MTSREKFEKWAIKERFAFRDKNGLWPMGGGTLYQLQAAWQASRVAALEEATRIVETYQVSVGNSAAGEIACEMTMDSLREILIDDGHRPSDVDEALTSWANYEVTKRLNGRTE